jgi:hypothetical protein
LGWVSLGLPEELCFFRGVGGVGFSLFNLRGGEGPCKRRKFPELGDGNRVGTGVLKRAEEGGVALDVRAEEQPSRGPVWAVTWCRVVGDVVRGIVVWHGEVGGSVVLVVSAQVAVMRSVVGPCGIGVVRVPGVDGKGGSRGVRVELEGSYEWVAVLVLPWVVRVEGLCR